MAMIEGWISRHERECTVRWGTLIKLIGWGGAVAVATMIGIAGWGLNKTWDGQQEQMRVLRDLQMRVPVAAQAR